jgi:hypothetical protein
MFKRPAPPLPQTTAQRLTDVGAEIRMTFAGLKPRAVVQAEERLVSARDTRAALSPQLVKAMNRDRHEGRQGPSGETRELQAAQAQTDSVIRDRKTELEAARVGFRALVDVSAESHLRAVDDALVEATAIIGAAAEALAEIERYRAFNGISVSPGRWRASRDFRHLSAIAKDIAG